MTTRISANNIKITLIKELFFDPIASIIYPINIPPRISPIPNDTIASIDSSNCSFSLSPLFAKVLTIIGTNNPVYTAKLMPVQHI